MFEILEKVILAGVGLMSMTKEKAENLVDALIERGQVKAKDRKTVLNKFIKGSKKFDKDLEKKLKKASSEIMDRSQKQIDALRKKIEKVSKDLHFKGKKGKIKK